MQPESAEDFNLRGLKRLVEGAFDQAISDFEQALARKPRYVEALVNRGNAYSGAGHRDRARADLEKAIEIDPNCAGAHIARGYFKCEAGDYHGAIADLSRALGLAPGDATALSGRGMAQSLLGDFDRAVEDYSAAIGVKPGAPEFYVGRGDALAQQGKYSAAIDDYSLALRLNPRLGGAYAGRALVRYKCADYEEAADDAENALIADPSIAGARQILSNARRALGDSMATTAAPVDGSSSIKGPDSIGAISFERFAAPLLALPVSHVWQGHGSAVFLEFGKLTPRTKHDGSPGNPDGEMSLMCEGSWRIEGRRTILCGSWNNEKEWPPAFAFLKAGRVIQARVFGHLPELEIVLSNGVRFLSFQTYDGDPAWTLFDRRGSEPRWIHVRRGRLRIEIGSDA